MPQRLHLADNWIHTPPALKESESVQYAFDAPRLPPVSLADEVPFPRPNAPPPFETPRLFMPRWVGPMDGYPEAKVRRANG